MVGDHLVQEQLGGSRAVGVLERGRFNVAQTVQEQPWLPNGPVPRTVDWTRDSGRPDPVPAGSSHA